jgi:hypothetical protein
MFDVWLRWLLKVDVSVLWLFKENEIATITLFQQAQKRVLAFVVRTQNGNIQTTNTS